MSRSARVRRSLVQILAGGLQAELGLTEDEAVRIACGMARWIAPRAGGDVLYVPKACEIDRAARNAAIRREFNGRNRDEICARYRVSKSTFYDIIGGPRR